MRPRPRNAMASQPLRGIQQREFERQSYCYYHETPQIPATCPDAAGGTTSRTSPMVFLCVRTKPRKRFQCPSFKLALVSLRRGRIIQQPGSASTKPPFSRQERHPRGFNRHLLRPTGIPSGNASLGSAALASLSGARPPRQQRIPFPKMIFVFRRPPPRGPTAATDHAAGHSSPDSSSSPAGDPSETSAKRVSGLSAARRFRNGGTVPPSGCPSSSPAAPIGAPFTTSNRGLRPSYLWPWLSRGRRRAHPQASKGHHLGRAQESVWPQGKAH